MAVKIETPPQLRGNPVDQLQQMYSFLFRLSENLNTALGQMENTVAKQTASVVSGTASGLRSGAKDDGYDDLRALIINTAGIVRKEMDVIERTLTGKYTAISDEWGEYQETIHTTITETAEATIMSLGYGASIKGIEEYLKYTEGYIKQGFIEYDDAGKPIIGIAIGQKITQTGETWEDEDGNTYDRLDSANACAFYTADKVSFRMNGQEMAFFSMGALSTGKIEVAESIVIGTEDRAWQIRATANGLSIKWIGGEA